MTSEASDSPLRIALIAQVFGALIAVGLIALAYPKLFDSPLAVAGIQGLCAAFTSRKLDAPPWWQPIHLLFMPLVVLGGRLELHPAWYLAAFLLTLLIFWRTDRSRVPLYLSSKQAAEALADLLPAQPCSVADLGCGNGALLGRLARLRPDCRFLGVEHAPLPWAWARLSAGRLSNCTIRCDDFWRLSLEPFDVVYAFLSPAPMPRLWAKACAEMSPGALLVSNSFVIPEVAAERVVAAIDRPSTQLFCYRPGAQKKALIP